MILEMASLSESFGANLAFVWFFSSVLSHVNFQITSQSEHLLTNFTLVFFDSFVNVVAMSFHLKPTSKCFRALRTTERLVSGMDGHVAS